MHKVFRRLVVPLWAEISAALAVALAAGQLYKGKPWIIAGWAALALVLAALLSCVLIYLRLGKPLAQLTAGIKASRLHADGADGTASLPRTKLLGPLAQEVDQLLQSLAQARSDAVQEARLRLEANSLWTAERLKEFTRQKLGNRKLFAVSHREPYQHWRRNGGIECVIPPSGLVTAMEPVLRAAGGTWLAASSGDADFEVTDAHGRVAVPPDAPAYTLKRILIPEEEEKAFNLGCANEGIWPLCHIAHIRPVFRRSDWEAYVRANRRYADSLLEEIGDQESPLIFIQDYHFALMARMLRRAKPDARIALFWHIPWPDVERLAICPWKEELIDGLLGADILGFHLQSYCANFMAGTDRYLESRMLTDRCEIVRAGHVTQVRPFPIGIAFTDKIETKSGPPASELKAAILKRHGVSAEFLGVGVDRLDYTKGILERFWAIEKLLADYPSYIGRFTFIELGAPTRTQIERYSDLARDIEQTVERINGRFATRSWRPIIFFKDQHDQETIQLYYKAAELCLVTSLHDGMNLVAMEYVASRSDGDGVLVLSRFTGAAEELKDAVLVNPYDIDALTATIRDALEMPAEERRLRMSRLRECIREHNVFRWAGELIDGLCRTQSRAPAAPSASSPAAPNADMRSVPRAGSTSFPAA